MRTATDYLMRQDGEREQQILNRRIEAFILDFAPEDRRSNAIFCARLIELVRNAYSCAAEPYEKTMSSMLNHQSINMVFRNPLAQTPEKTHE